MSSLRKHPFLHALRRWVRFARRNVVPPRETCPAAKSDGETDVFAGYLCPTDIYFSPATRCDCLIFLTLCQCHFSYLLLPLSLEGHPHQHACQTGPHRVQKQTVFSKVSLYSGQNCIACMQVNDAPPIAFVAGAG